MAIHAMVGRKDYGRPYILWFGAYATQVLVYADSLEDALEDAAQEIADRGWVGLFSPPDYAGAMMDLIEEGRIPPGPVGIHTRILTCDCRRGNPCPVCLIMEQAEQDHTYTESGWILSWEWGIVAEDPSPKTIATIGHERA